MDFTFNRFLSIFLIVALVANTRSFPHEFTARDVSSDSLAVENDPKPPSGASIDGSVDPLFADNNVKMAD